MKISPKRIGLWLPVLTAFSLTQAEVSADILSNRTPEQTNSEAPDAYFVQLPPARANDPGVTVFPQAIALAATWDPVVHQQVGEVTSTEALCCPQRSRVG
jgi:hypothetical protein